jgi:hypothetical protein
MLFQIGHRCTSSFRCSIRPHRQQTLQAIHCGNAKRYDMTRSGFLFWRHLSPVLWFGVISCTVFWRVVFRGEVLYYGDIMLYFHPALAFEHHWLKQGILPLWNPHTLFGQPFVGNPQEWLLYPFTLLIAWLGAERGISWGAVIHLWLAGTGVWLFARRLGYTHRRAVAAGTLWMLCGAVVLRSQHVGILHTLAWYGWSFWAVEGLLQRAEIGRAIWLAVVLALMSLAGSPQMAHMLILVLLGWVLYRWRTVADKKGTLYWGGAAVVIALLIGGAHWLPLAELLRHTDRVHLALRDSAGYTFHPDHILLFLAPNLYGFPWHGNYAITLFYWEVAFFAGTIPTIVLLLRWRRTNESTERFWKRTFVLSVWMAAGPYAGLYAVAYYIVPGMQSFRTPLRWMTIADFALCLWAAAAFERVGMSKRWWWLPVWMAIFAGIWQIASTDVALHLAPSPEEAAKALALAATIRAALWRAAGMCAIAIGILSLQNGWRWWLGTGVTLAELLWIAIPANPTCSPAAFAVPLAATALQQSAQRLFLPDTAPIWLRYVNAHDYGSSDLRTLRMFRASMCSNIGMAHGVSEASGYEPAPLRESLRVFTDLQMRWRNDPTALQRVGVGSIASGSSADDWRITPAPKPGSRAWMLGPAEPANLQMPTPQRVVLSPPRGGRLLLTDSAYPGWRVFLDGKPAEWHVYERAFRTVDVPDGVRRVEWRYTPGTFRVGLFLTCIGFAMLAGLVGYALCKKALDRL